ncbi:MAG: transketolase [Patescibacteria group bacterium]
MASPNQKKIVELSQKASRIRQLVISMLAEAGSGHPGGSLGMADIFAALYFHILKHDPKKPDWPDRDRLILSNGHICPARYAAMALAGYFPERELLTLRRLGSRLQGHPERERLPGLESTSGPLGAGLAQAAGLALAAKMDRKTWTTWCLTSDGEHDAGLHWEAVLFAGANNLNNLICVVDRNRIQLDGETETIMRLEPLREKYLAFNWNVIDVDGHDLPSIIQALETAKTSRQRPTAIIARTTLGKGVSFMEDDFHWHGETPTCEQADQALAELRKDAAKPYQAKPKPGSDLI